MKAWLFALVVACTPSLTFAFGGLFSSGDTPVRQAAERVLFAPEGDQMHMVVGLTWDGPPGEFVWLLPVPQDVETWVGSESVFRMLEANGPRLQAPIVYQGDCEAWERELREQEGGEGEGEGDGELRIIGRDPVGPYERVILRAEGVDTLLAWLRDNEYRVPPGAEALLAPYVDLGMAWIALKFLPGADTTDIVPLHLRYTGDTPVMPIRLTAVGAMPDTDITAYFLGEARAVATNYPHVTIDPAAIDWFNGGLVAGYNQVLAQAVDEAGGHAMVTEFAGRHPGWALSIPDSAALEALEEIETVADFEAHFADTLGTDEDLRRAVRHAVALPETIPFADFLNCPSCFSEVTIDGSALAAAIREHVVEPRARLAPLFSAPWLTRLRTTLNADEMSRDPVFAFNPDLGEVSNVVGAERRVPCAEGYPQFDQEVIWVGDRVLHPGGAAIERQAGETVHGVGRRAAMRIETQFAEGQPEVIVDYTGAEPGPDDPWSYAPDNMGADGGPGATPDLDDESGCSCRADGHAPSPLWLAALAMLGLVRRRR